MTNTTEATMSCYCTNDTPCRPCLDSLHRGMADSFNAAVGSLNDAEIEPLHPDYDPDYDDGMSDAEADADALASAGWGTDEDYGYFGGED